ncbi:uncharacterized protein LOC129799993 [Phlebotomus papatasi]|uniref:Uncharacterized protein n=1 Tax=Phlebotomus papatasi TaxID=29031 RepID=A0A1B0CZL1_PHLPP|nr:uncharacterized protein LOC129799993 [Phlebotomus papatasi]XP_055700309.1 uncharacterized protein LOC129799993 [Phlebotomus papatasi]XP_055700310.1 uncharacterized protein LOC129799993 [Phlebotomus papatasi]XP_055700311.1 uncharacterized protein LOC129799993 [Phlebotomus papatasi]
MELGVPPELEELILCSCCHLPFNDTDATPKLFSCRHHFCLKCVNSVLLKGGELYCVHCWKRTELPAPDMKPENLPTYNAILYLASNLNLLNLKSKPPDKGTHQIHTTTSGTIGNSLAAAAAAAAAANSAKMKKGENCMTHAMPNALWCLKCHTLVCRACAGSEEHRNHTVKTQLEARDAIRNDIATELLSMQKSLSEVQHLVLKQRDFLLKILEACTSLKTQVETELINHLPTFEIAEMRESLGKAKIYLNMLEQQTPADAYKLYTTLHLEKQRLQSKHQEMFLQCKLDDLIRNYGVLFDFELIKQALATLHSGETFNSITMNGMGHHNPILLLANYCISQLYSRHILTNKHSQALAAAAAANGSVYHQAGTSQALTPSPHDPGTPHAKSFADLTSPNKNTQPQQPPLPPGAPQPPVGTGSSYGHHSDALVPVAQGQGPQQANLRHSTYEINGMAVPISMMQHLQQQQQQLSNSQASIQSPQPPICTPTVHVYPIYYFNIEINGSPCGRILIEVRNDVAPKMAKNFGALATGELGFGYKGCQIFQCWENESIITGDFELNNGRGGRSVFEEGFFMPDDTKILAIRGSVGMRRSQKRHDNMGLVGSQFRIILREMRGFTGIFAFVVEGLDLVEKISQAGDSAGKPQSNVVIVNCGKLQ